MTNETIGFIGLGVMGGPMCHNVARKHPGRLLAHDMTPAALDALSGTKAEPVDIAAIAGAADIVCLSLPGGPQVEAVCEQLVAVGLRAGSVVIDLSTTPVAVARTMAGRLAGHGIDFVDAPVARTREAAQRGELSIMVGASAPSLTVSSRSWLTWQPTSRMVGMSGQGRC